MTSSRHRFRRIDKLGGVAAQWLIFSAVGDGVMVAWSLVDLVVLNHLDQLPQNIVDAWNLSGLIGFVQMALYITTVVIVGRWIYRANANTRAEVRWLDTPPAWAVGWFFIPIANLWKPYQAMAALVEANRPMGPDLPLGPWWAAWLASGIITNISSRLAFSSSEPSALITSSALGVIAGLAGIIAALLFRRILIAVTDAQNVQRQADVF